MVKSMKRIHSYISKPSRSRKPSKSTYMTRSRCKTILNSKIRMNMVEYKNGRYSNRKQAIAVAYSQIKKKFP